MASYLLSGTGTQGITLGVTMLRATIETFPLTYSNGRANPTNSYDVGLLRLGTLNAWRNPIPLIGGPQAIDVPEFVDTIGWNLFEGAEVLIEEAMGVTPLLVTSIGGTSTFPGAEFVFQFSGEASPTVGDWLTIQLTTEPLGFTNRQLDDTDGFIYASSGTESHGPVPLSQGTWPATINPSAPGGTYEGRWYANDLATLIASSASFTVS